MVLDTFTLLCFLHHYLSSELFLYPQMQLCTHLNINSPFSSFAVLSTTILTVSSV